MLDTSVAIALRDGAPDVLDFVYALGSDVLLSIVTLVELEGGVERNRADAAVRRSRLSEMLLTVRVVEFDRLSAEAYGRIVRAAGYSRRKLIDRMIAAQALVHDAVLVTRNTADVKDIPHLQLATC